MDIKMKKLTLVTLFLIVNLLIISTLGSNLLPYNTNDIPESIEKNGTYKDIIQSNSNEFALLYDQNLTDKTHSLIHFGDSLEEKRNYTIPLGYYPLAFIDSRYFFIETELRTTPFQGDNSPLSANVLKLEDGEFSLSQGIHFYFNDEIPVQNTQIEIHDVEITEAKISVLFGFGINSNETSYLVTGVFDIEYDDNSAYLSQPIFSTRKYNSVNSSRYSVIQRDLEFDSLSRINEIIKIRNIFFQGELVINHLILQYEVIDDRLEIYDFTGGGCQLQYCDYLFIGDTPYLIEVNTNKSQSIFRTFGNNSITHRYDYSGNSTSLNPIKVNDDIVLFSPLFQFTTNINGYNSIFQSSYIDHSHYYKFDVDSPDDLVQVETNPNNYQYYLILFQSISEDNYLTIIQEYLGNPNQNTQFTIIKEIQPLIAFIHTVKEYQWWFISLPNLVFLIFAIKLYRKKSRVMDDSLYPSEEI